MPRSSDSLRKASHRRRNSLRFTSPERTPLSRKRPGECAMVSRAGTQGSARPKQAIVVMPQWNADAFSHNALCTIFNRMGISALRLSKPYHDIRRPVELERSDYAVSANIWGARFRRAGRQWSTFAAASTGLKTQGYEHFGVLGTSLGSCYGFLASAHDKRIRVNAFNHASTAFGDVVWAGQSTRHIRQALTRGGTDAGSNSRIVVGHQSDELLRPNRERRGWMGR